MSTTTQVAAKFFDAGGAVFNVKHPDYGATGDGTTDDSTAIQAAIDAADANTGGIVFFPEGTYNFGTTLQMDTNVTLQGSGEGTTILDYDGSADAIVSKSPGTRTYQWYIRDMTIQDSGSGVTGIELDSVSSSQFENLKINGFATGIDIYSPTSGYSVYNRFWNVTVQGTASVSDTGYKLRGTSSNANTFDSCRTNLCETGVDISDSNDNSFYFCQFESGSGAGATTAVKITASTPGISPQNKFFGVRMEGGWGTGYSIGADVSSTVISWPYFITGITTPVSDSGTRTMIWGLSGDDVGSKFISALTDAKGTPWYFERVTSASTNPAFHIKDSNTGSGTPTTLLVETGRAGGKFFSGERASTEYAYINASGGMMLAGSAPTVSTGEIGYGSDTQATVGSAGGASALPATPTGYVKINVAGTDYVIPYYAAS